MGKASKGSTPAASDLKAGKAVAASADAGTKKKRTTNPGVRIQGGRVYDSENGTTCHQCRQKTIEIKAKCNSCTLYFCPRCLENRYNELVADANATPDWSCPRCRQLCNCSNCRKKQGLEATGILANVAKTAGFGSVSELLKKNPKAQALNMMIQNQPTATSPGGTKTVINNKATKKGENAAVARGSKNTTTASTAADVDASARTKAMAAKKRKSTDTGLIPDDLLGPRNAPMPTGTSLAIHIVDTDAAPASKRMNKAPAWVAQLPQLTQLPEDIEQGQLVSILEFLATFAQPLGLKSGQHSGALAAELCQPATTKRVDLLVPVPEDSTVASVHCELLSIVRNAWGVQGKVALSSWQTLMQAYYAATQIPTTSWELQWEHGPPAVAGEIFIRPHDDDDETTFNDEDSSEQQEEVEEEEKKPRRNPSRSNTKPSSSSGEDNTTTSSDQQQQQEASARRDKERAAAPAAAIDYPPGGYWAVSPRLRVEMLHALVHDALDTYPVRQIIEKSMEDAAVGEKERKSNLADVRREAKEAAARMREQEVAMIIANGTGKAMSLEEQRALLENARQKAEQATTAASAARVKALSASVHAPAMRIAPLGFDRDGRAYYKLQCGSTVAGPVLSGGSSPNNKATSKAAKSNRQRSSSSGGTNTNTPAAANNNKTAQSGLVVLECTNEGTASEQTKVTAICNVAGVMAALDDKGQKEGVLKHSLTFSYGDAGKSGDGSKAAKKGGVTPGKSAKKAKV